jgi:hypothetical protein
MDGKGEGRVWYLVSLLFFGRNQANDKSHKQDGIQPRRYLHSLNTVLYVINCFFYTADTARITVDIGVHSG